MIKEITSDILNNVIGQIKPTDRVVMASKEIEPLNFPVDQSSSRQGIGKPNGLWYAVGTTWIDWVKNEMPEWIKNWKYVYKLEIDESKMVMIKNGLQLKAFNEKYSYSKYPQFKDPDGKHNDIDWVKTSNDYSGIEIAPYQWSYRHEYLWYYTWDVASGCVWERDAIKKIIKVKI